MHRRSVGATQTAITSPPIVTEPRRVASTSRLGALFRTDESKTKDAKLLDAFKDLTLAQELRIKAAESERSGGNKLAEWAKKTQNSAINDVGAKTSTVLQMHSDATMELALRNQRAIGQLRGLCGRGKELEDSEKEYQRLKEKEAKLQKQLNSRRDRPHDPLEAQISDVRRQINFTWENIRRLYGDEETIRMMKLRHGCKGIADAGMTYTTAARAIFACLRELTETIPGLTNPGEEIFGMTYEGAPFTQERVEQLKAFLSTLQNNDKLCVQHGQDRSQLLGGVRRRSEPARRTGVFGPNARTAAPSQQHAPASPPPPYTPSAPAGEMERSTTSTTSGTSSSRLPHLQPIPLAAATAPTMTPIARPAPKSHAPYLQPIRNEDHPTALAQLASSNERRKENRRSLPACTGCSGRLYPELPPNPYRTQQE
ncbi:unnamed protein product, partial [Mesorhabditis belari]|uniref:Uncharacterized protein n=1 Tax=Mesorhabditis belari TaxID=2138241 RepID=A0AAF3JBM0_9BILA